MRGPLRRGPLPELKIMDIKKQDYFYMLLAIAISAVGVVAIGNPNTSVGLYGLIGLLGVALVMIIIIKPSFGAYILILTIFINISDNLTKRDLPGVIKPLVFIVAVAIIVHYAYSERVLAGGPKTRNIELFLFLYLFAVSLSYLAASNKDRAAAQILDFVKDIGILYCILFALRRFASWKLATWVIILSTTFLSLLGLYQVVTGNYEQTFVGMAAVQMEKVFGSSTTARLSGPINAPNLWGQILVAVIPLVVYRILHERHRMVRLICVVILGLMLAVVFNTYSRGAYLGLAIIFILIFLEKRLDPMVMFGGVTLIAILVLVLPSNYTERFRSLSALSPASEYGIYQDSSLRGRSSEILTGLRMFYEHPLLGVGAGNYRNNYQKYTQLIGLEFRSEQRDPHSLYVQLLSETGIVGTIAFLGLAITLLGGLSKSIKSIEHLPHAQSWLPWIFSLRLSIISYLITSLFLHGAYIRYFWIFVALAISVIRLTDDLVNRYRYSSPLEQTVD